MSDEQQTDWYAGDAFGLDADYSYVIRVQTRPPSGLWGDGDDGDSEPVCIAQSAEYRDRIIADHNARAKLEQAVALLRGLHDEMDDLNADEFTGAPWCRFCDETGYDGNGLIHKESCVLLPARAFLAAIAPPAQVDGAPTA